MGSCLTFRNELSEETHGLTKQETLLGRGRPGGKQQRDPGELLCHVARRLRVYGNEVGF